MLKLTNIRIENGTRDVITDSKQPRFSFSLSSDRQGAALSRCRITVKAGATALWDSGWRTDGRQISIPYAGKPLTPFTEYAVTVEAEDNLGQRAAGSAGFSTGRLDSPWQAAWITDPTLPVPEKSSPQPLLFRKKIALREAPVQAWLCATALGIYELTLNGKRLGDRYFAPGFTSYEHQIQYQSYAVRDLHAGEIEIRALVGPGWAVGAFTYTRSNQTYADTPALLLELRVKYADGTEEIFGSGPDWELSREGALRFADWYDGEVYDATVDENRLYWTPARVTAPRGNPRLLAEYGAPVRAIRRLEPVTVFSAPNGERVYDFGQNFAGVIDAKITGKQGQRLFFSHAEVCKDGELFTKPLRTAKARIEYVCRDGSQHYSPRMTYMGFRYAEHDNVALQAAVEGMVLLKNEDDALPLSRDAKLNVFGAAQYMLRNSATGAGLINPRWQADFHQAVQEHSSFTVNTKISRLYSRLIDVAPTESELKTAKEQSGIALIFLSRSSGEFLDNKPIRGGYYLTEDEEAMIRAVTRVFEKTVAILNTGYPIDLRWMERYHVKAALYTGFAGMGAGYALVELLDGRQNPSGHLPDTWALDYYDYPSAANFMNYREGDQVPGEKAHGVRLFYEEDLYVGYRYFDSFDKPVQYPFGHGLSYTRFDCKVTSCVAGSDGMELTARVENTGDHPGKAVLQLYVSAPEGRLEKPRRVLTDFAKTKLLAPGESETLSFRAAARNMASYDEARSAYVLEPGVYTLYLGQSLAQAEPVGSFRIHEEKVLKTVTPVARPVEEFHRLSKAEPFVNRDSRVVSLEERFPVKAERKAFRPTPLNTSGRKRVSFAELKENPALLDDFVAQLTVDELCRLNVSTGADWYMPWGKGTAGGTPAIRKYGLPAIRVSDGNTGLNIVKPNVGFPSSCTVAASFNKALARKIGRVIGEESRENGIAVNLGPGMNLHRNILCGRHPEYFSEDPLLSGVMAGFHAKGIESTGTRATYKHLFCNNSETSRKGSHSIVSQRALRELYFRTFEIAMEIQKPGCLMTSYNAINGIYPAESAELLQTLVRGEWGFDGLIMTDWCSYDTIDPVEIVKAGTDWLTEGGGKYVRILKKAVKDGRLSADVLRDNARYVIAWVLNARKGNDK